MQNIYTRAYTYYFRPNLHHTYALLPASFCIKLCKIHTRTHAHTHRETYVPSTYTHTRTLRQAYLGTVKGEAEVAADACGALATVGNDEACFDVAMPTINTNS